MKSFPEESIDLLCTDPPYGISFMGKDWDTFNEVVNPQGAYAKKKGFTKLPRNKPIAMLEFFVPIWKECLRILKPGSFMFIMCAARQDTQSKQVLALEQAGFNIGFTPIYWTYATGFPKTGNIGKLIDKKLGKEREVVGKKECGYQVSISKKRKEEGYRPNLTTSTKEVDITIPSSDEAKALNGSYTGFNPKPAVEVILVAMKPLSEKTYVEQALRNGKGITWLENCRIPYENEKDKFDKGVQSGLSKVKFFDEDNSSYVEKKSNLDGRFPANLICSDDVLNDGKIRNGSPVGFKNVGWKHSGNTKEEMTKLDWQNEFNDSGSFSRYFDLDRWWIERVKGLPEVVRKTFPFLIVPKASKSERNKDLEKLPDKLYVQSSGGKAALKRGETEYLQKGHYRMNKIKIVKNNHPTVKPIKLMSYLVTLGSREGDVVLDPFCGSGTTLLASEMLNRRWIGIEIGKEYHTLAVNRLAPLMKQTRFKGSMEDN
ncbi:hypothetical protein LCGC14_2480630 [marine sediment metagenome]|uniref:DNA methylase N-4/N-6 domain-containing protein n=1 Tax=marine sediment metagenome TaxID=412755 RepID=A0A0F9E1D5_9ZZZZ